MPKFHDKTMPGESDDYRTARDKLLEAEIDLRRRVETVAALRRELPLGGALKEDYVFDERDANGGTKQTRLSDLFEAVTPGTAGILLLDVRLPDINGLEVQERLVEMRVPLSTIIITGHGDVPMAV